MAQTVKFIKEGMAERLDFKTNTYKPYVGYRRVGRGEGILLTKYEATVEARRENKEAVFREG